MRCTPLFRRDVALCTLCIVCAHVGADVASMTHAVSPSSTKKIAEVQSLKSLAITAVLQNLSRTNDQCFVEEFACSCPTDSAVCVND